jgi:hypothetical protein
MIAALLALATSTMIAQESGPIDAHAVACGMQIVDEHAHAVALANTARLNPALYDQMVRRAAAQKGSRMSIMSAEGETVETFYVYNNKTAMYDNVVGVLAYDGILARVWIDARDTARVKASSSQFRMLVRALDTATTATSHNPSQGILANDIELFGAPPTTYQVAGKTDFLLTDIKEAIQGGYIAGYFSPLDQTPSAGSNTRNILYIDSREGLSSTTNLLNTIAHEYQHLIHYARRRNSELFFNEGCSEVASILNGYWNRTNSGYMANTNVDLLTWPSGTTNGSLLLATYERAMTFTHFLHEQYGDTFLYDFVGSTARGVLRVDDGLKQAGLYSESVNWKTALRYFAVANYLQTSTEPQFGYQFKVGSRKPTLLSSFVGETMPETGTVSVNRYGIAYVQIAGPGKRIVRFAGAGEFRVMAMITTNGVLEIRELEDDQTYVLGSDAVADKTVLAFVNLASITNPIQWTATPTTTSAVNGETGVTKRMGISGIAPNPIRESAILRFATAGQAPVTLELIDARGQRVRTFIDGASMDAGWHEIAIDVAGLPSGYYMAALRQGSEQSTHVVVVAH